MNIQKLLFTFLLFVPLFTMGQQKTYVLDDNFEMKLELMGFGEGWMNLNDSVYTDAIDTLLSLTISSSGISTIKGIEDFIY